MAHRVVWSPAALEDVDAIAAYIARDSPRYAAAVVRQFFARTRQLSQFPHSGRRIQETEDESLRELLVAGHRLIYRVQDRTVTIAAVVHDRQSFDAGVGRVQTRGA